MDWGVGQEGWFAHPFGGAMCRDRAQYPAFAPDTSKVAAGFVVFLYRIVHNLLQVHLYAVIFSPF